MKFARLFLPCLLALISSAAPAKADWDGLGLAYLYGYGGLGQAGFRSFGPQPPYFALHPPVYYGQRYTRPYGASPFASWPQLQGNSHYAPAPHVRREQIIPNPYAPCRVASPASPGGVVKSTPIEPLIIENPHYSPAVRYTTKASAPK